MMNIRRKFWDIKMKIFSLLNKDAKILYDTMKELQIPENQLYLHDDESCPCGSGKSYKDCCKGKSDDGPVNSKKPVEVLLMEEMRKGFKQDKVCLHPDQANCKGKIKEAHALQNHKIISLLASADNHMIMQDPAKQPIVIKEDPVNPILIVPFTRVSGNKATTQSCFCDVHDTQAFKVIEAGSPDFDANNDEMKFVYAYKAFVFEYAKQRHLMWLFRRMFSKRPGVFSLPEQVKEYRIQCLRMEEFETVKKKFDTEILAGTHDGISTVVVTIPYKLGFANYAYIAPDYDIDGNRIKSIDNKGKMHRLAITVLPEVNQSYILMSCLDSEEEFYRSFFQSIKTANLEKILFYFNLMLPLFSENVILSEALWNALDEKGQFGLTHMANLTGDDQLKLSQTLGMALRNAAHKKNFDYSKRMGFDLFQQV